MPNDIYNKRAIFDNSPDQIVETDTMKSFELDSKNTESVEFTMSESSREGHYQIVMKTRFYAL